MAESNPAYVRFLSAQSFFLKKKDSDRCGKVHHLNACASCVDTGSGSGRASGFQPGRNLC